MCFGVVMVFEVSHPQLKRGMLKVLYFKAVFSSALVGVVTNQHDWISLR